MTISVAMCTYNGAKYIEEQLKSIMNQTHPVDEIVICDDGSTDETLNIITNVCQNFEGRVLVSRNEVSLGVLHNFEKAICQCSGEILFLSDQDDVWIKEKVQRVVEWFYENPTKEAVFSDAILIDEHEKRFTNRTLFDVVGMTPKAQRYFDKGYSLELFMKSARATGATMAIRKSVIQRIPQLFEQTIDRYHDEMICIDTIQRNSLGYCPLLLTKYRIHSSQECGLGGRIKNVVKSDNALASYCWNKGILEYVSEESYKKRGLFLCQRRDLVMSKSWAIISILRLKREYKKYYPGYACYCVSRDIISSLSNSIKMFKGRHR